MNNNEDKFITQKKIMRLICYKQRKESKPERNKPLTIADVCPFEFTEINEKCKHCRWFQIKDETREVEQMAIPKGSLEGHPVSFTLKELREIEFDPNKPDQSVK